jgi:UDP-glucose 4-epimerase
MFGDDYPTRDGTCVRDYIHVWDLARAHVVALESLITAPACRAYNLGCGGMGYTVREVIDAVERVTRRQAPLRLAGGRRWIPRCSLRVRNGSAATFSGRLRFQNLDEIVASAWRWMGRRTNQTVS